MTSAPGHFEPLPIRDIKTERLECLDGPEGCKGAVEYRMALSPSGRSFPRCGSHWSERLDEDERQRERLGDWRSDVPPAWFDPLDAGESWADEPEVGPPGAW
jgi:hypothetical protein